MTCTAFDQSALSMEAICVKVIVKDSSVPSMLAKNVVCMHNMVHQSSATAKRTNCTLTITLISCSRSNHICTTFMTAFRSTSSASPFAADIAADAASFFWIFSRLALPISKEPICGTCQYGASRAAEAQKHSGPTHSYSSTLGCSNTPEPGMKGRGAVHKLLGFVQL